jgi:hypothetical protein
MRCASLLETVTEKNYPTLAPLSVNNPYFLYAPYFPLEPAAVIGNCHTTQQVVLLTFYGFLCYQQRTTNEQRGSYANHTTKILS